MRQRHSGRETNRVKRVKAVPVPQDREVGPEAEVSKATPCHRCRWWMAGTVRARLSQARRPTVWGSRRRAEDRRDANRSDSGSGRLPRRNPAAQAQYATFPGLTVIDEGTSSTATTKHAII
jgi:hypothetical protein